MKRFRIVADIPEHKLKAGEDIFSDDDLTVDFPGKVEACEERVEREIDPNVAFQHAINATLGRVRS